MVKEFHYNKYFKTKQTNQPRIDYFMKYIFKKDEEKKVKR